MASYFDDKTILITGAASGIGRRFAETVASRGVRKLVLWDRNPDVLDEVAAGIGDKCQVITHGVDVSSIESVTTHAEKLKSEGVVPDLILSCAGIVVGKMFHEHSAEEIQRTLDINTTGSMWVVHAFLEEMIERGSGHIVNLASASGYIGNPRMSVYAASKWAVIGWSESLRLEMGKLNTGISITSVVPSYIKTGMFEGVKAPFLVPLLETDQIVELMIKGISKKKSKIQAPFMVRFVPFIKSLLPERAFDWVAGNVLGVYRSMESFEGRERDKEKE
ncbi:SDR family NAD(P)-dependent oxidoreductase [Rhodohalobacter sp. 8-1]|uniref:SDR family NAD(P)-dependent oxidoreductase n=1 Tax=Rhodohalobacter sp. 8-1 TaxID=3131972 RepID=UPI0030EC5C0F